jgi:hypothetical protein
MEMDELEQAWARLDARLGHQDALLQQIRRLRGVDAVRSRLRLVSVGQLVQLAIGVAIVLWAGGYWYAHLGQAHLVVYGVALHLYGIALLVVSALQLVQLARVDYRQPVLELQGRLLRLRRLRSRSERVLLMAGMIAWVPLVFVGLAAIGKDVWLTRPGVVWSNLAVGVVLALLVDWLVRRYPATFDRDAAGRSLREAEAALAELGPADRP